MYNFVMENPTKILFGKDTISELGNEVKALGNKVLLVYGKDSIKKNGIYTQVTESLEANQLTIIEHGGVKSNPVLSHVRQGVTLAKENSIDVIVAVGGGSVIDASKAIAAGAVVDHDVWKFFQGKKGVTSPLPVCSVLTLAASGSEMNGGMVVTNDDKNHKLGVGNKKLCPQVSILDPQATFTVPPGYTAYGAIDAIAHILEFYFTSQLVPSPVQDRFMEGLIINLIESCDICLLDPENYEARANLMWCATMALNGWTSAGLGIVGFPMHMIEHSLSALYDVPHGAGLSIVIPAWMKWQSSIDNKKICQLAERVFSISEHDDKTQASQGIEALKSWFATVNSPTTLQDLSIPEKAIPELAEHSLIQAKLWRMKEYNSQIIEDILRLAI